MTLFPFFKDIKNAPGLIVGGGNVALRKAEKLLPYGPRLTIVAPDIRSGLSGLDVTCVSRAFQPEDITQDLAFVIAACDDRNCNRRISQLCRERNIPVNVVDDPELCTFQFPSLVQRGDLSVGISTGGSSPTAAIWLRKQVENLLPDNMDEILDALRQKREEAKTAIPDSAQRSCYLQRQFTAALAGGQPEGGHVSLVGAGCGMKNWITLEGLERLRRCDAVVYDDLIDKALLEEVPGWVEKISVGKRGGKPSARQEDIQRILVELAKQGKNVVRLKGGDPFVFGRGGEEIEALNQAGIGWSLVPGISSALAVPAQMGIPVTHRGVSRSIHIITAHTKEDALRRDMERLADLEGTLVILMGIAYLETIVNILKANGRDGSTPAAVLSGGNTPNPYKVTGTLDTIAAQAKQANVTAPGIIVIGDVVSRDLTGTQALALSGLRVGITGTDDFQEKLRRRLLRLGAEPVSLMGGICAERDCNIPWDTITSAEFKWLIFTSAHGVRYFFRKAGREGVDYRRFAACKFAVIGEATGEALAKQGFQADLCPSEFTSPALADALAAAREPEEKLYLFCSQQGTDLLANRLSELNITCKRYEVYGTELEARTGDWENLRYVLFGSAEGVRALGRGGFVLAPETTPVCIGPICAQAVREQFGREPLVAAHARVDDLTAILEK